MSEENRYMSVKQIVARTDLSERTVRAMIADGRLPAIRPEGLRVVRIPESAVLKLMESASAGA